MLRVTVSILYICSLNIQSHDIIKQNIFFIEFQFYDKYLFKSLIPVAMWSKVRVCSCSIAGIAASNPTEGMDVCFLYLLCLCVCVCLIVCDLETPTMKQPVPKLGCCGTEENDHLNHQM